MLKTTLLGLSCSSALLLTNCTEVNSVASTTHAPTTYNSFYPAVAVKSQSPSSLGSKTDRHGYPVYDISDKKRYVRTTAYSDAEKEKGGIYKNYNAAGTYLKYGKVRSAAADWSVYPLGTLFRIKGLPHTYVIDDYGSALVGGHSIDIYHPSLSSMRRWGTRPAEIQIIRMGDWERSAYLLKGRAKHKHCAQMYAGVLKNMKLANQASAKNSQQKKATSSYSRYKG